MENIKFNENLIEEVSDQELEEATGAKGSGWLRTVTDDCPNSIIVCC